MRCAARYNRYNHTIRQDGHDHQVETIQYGLHIPIDSLRYSKPARCRRRTAHAPKKGISRSNRASPCHI